MPCEQMSAMPLSGQRPAFHTHRSARPRYGGYAWYGGCSWCAHACRRLLLKLVAGSRYLPGMANLADFAFNMVEGMQGYYTYVES